jgi:hypothetical protein
MAGGLGFPFEVGGPSSESVTGFKKVAFLNYREDPAILGSTGGAPAVVGDSPEGPLRNRGNPA